MPSREIAIAARNAAAMFKNWRTKGSTDDLRTLMECAGVYDQDQTNLVCALLSVGCEMAKAAADGQADAYLESVLRDASLDEVRDRP